MCSKISLTIFTNNIFGNHESLVIKLALLNKTPDLCKKHWPCNEKSQDSRNHLLTKNSNARSEIDHSILIWKKFDLERRFQAKNCFEKAALSNGNLMTARDKALIINLITLVDEMLGNLGGNHGDQIRLSTQKFFCLKNTHSNNFLVCFLSLTAAT